MRLRIPIFGYEIDVAGRVLLRRRERYTWDQLRERINAGEVAVCVSRCLYCGRPTPHETCHAHSTELGFVPESVECLCKLWEGDQEPEACVDPACPVWEPGDDAALRGRQEKETVLP